MFENTKNFVNDNTFAVLALPLAAIQGAAIHNTVKNPVVRTVAQIVVGGALATLGHFIDNDLRDEHYPVPTVTW